MTSSTILSLVDLSAAFGRVLRFDLSAPQPATVTLPDGAMVPNLLYTEQQAYQQELSQVEAGAATAQDALDFLLQQAQSSTSVATLSYQFFTGATDGLIGRTVFPTKPPSVEYELTPLGRTILPPLGVLVDWADRSHAAIRSARAAFDARPD